MHTIVILDEDFVIQKTCQSQLEFFAGFKDEWLKLRRVLCDAVAENDEHVTDA